MNYIQDFYDFCDNPNVDANFIYQEANRFLSSGIVIPNEKIKNAILGLYILKNSKTYIIIYQCCVCKKFLRIKDGKGNSGISHGFCEECYRKILKQRKLT